MTGWRLVRRSLAYHWRTHLGVLLGCAVAAAVLVGALVVGDSVRQSLLDIAAARLGRVQLAATTPERFFLDDLGTRIAPALQAPVAAVLELPGVAATSDGAARANRVRVLGVDDAFWSLKPGEGVTVAPDAAGVVVNQALATQLGVKVGDTVVLRINKPGTLPRDMPLASDEDAVAARRLTVRAIADDAHFGRFSLRAQQTPPMNAFVDRAALQQWVELGTRANLLLTGAGAGQEAKAQAALEGVWRDEDAELIHTGRMGSDSAINFPSPREAREWRQVSSRRVFMKDFFAPDPQAPRGMQLLAQDPQAARVLTYFVNALETGTHATPYSMVTAATPGVEATLRAVLPTHDDQIVLNQWAAADLDAKVGDAVRLRYYVISDDGRLIEQSRSFTVSAIVPITADERLIPHYPGLTDSEHCRDWRPGMPIDLHQIRDKDEDYWSKHRDAPKAFVTLAAGQAMWANRFGALTTVLLPGGIVWHRSREFTNPRETGLVFTDAQAMAHAAGTQGVDFGGLFLGLSVFLIAAAVILTTLLFVFGVEQRAREVGMLLAVGLNRKRVRRLLVCEGLLLAVVGSTIGAGLGLLYTRAMLWGLSSVWSGAVASADLAFHVRPTTVATGVIISVVVAVLAMAWPLRRLSRMPAAGLLAAGAAALTPPLQVRGSRRGAIAAVVGVLGAAALLPLSRGRGGPELAGVFFGVGALLLVAGLGGAHVLLRSLRGAGRMSVTALGVSNAVRRSGRSLATVSLLACGCFLVLAVSANRQDPLREASSRQSGTGGFALLGESALPVLQDLNSEAGRDAWALQDRDMQGVQVTALRLREGDDASCLNLNRAQRPRLLGVPVAAMADRFIFARGEGWSALSAPGDDADVIPGVADQATAMWALGKGVGDSLEFTDESGRPFRVKLVGLLADTVMQGNVMISEQALLARYPSTAGRRVFLIDAPADRVAAVSAALSQSLQDAGLELTPAVRRLGELMAVQNTYLAIFGVLGGLGMLLGSAGLAVVVLRNVLERRGELAVMSAMGLSASTVRRVVLAEHVLLLALGLAVGVTAALAAMAPVLMGQGSRPPVGFAAAVVVAMAGCGVVWVWLAVRAGVRGRVGVEVG
jgi:ABC-type antimicrobial peptide transport system permease subunit